MRPHKAGMLMLLIKVSRVKKKKRKTSEQTWCCYQPAVGEFQSIGYQENQFDAIALIYAHFPADKKNQVITKHWQPIRPGGIVILKLSVKSI
jgi:hypothetical protein